MIRTYVDANLLITAFRGNDAGVVAALAVLDDARRVVPPNGRGGFLWYTWVFGSWWTGWQWARMEEARERQGKEPLMPKRGLFG